MCYEFATFSHFAKSIQIKMPKRRKTKVARDYNNMNKNGLDEAKGAETNKGKKGKEVIVVAGMTSREQSPASSPIQESVEDLQARLDDVRAQLEQARKKDLKRQIEAASNELKGESGDPKEGEGIQNAQGLAGLKARVKTEAPKLDKVDKFAEYVAAVKGKYPELDTNELKNILELADGAKKPALAVRAEASGGDDRRVVEYDDELEEEEEEEEVVEQPGKKTKQLSSGMLDKARSTKIRTKALWPHAMLTFDTLENDISFDQLSLSQLFCGELNIISRDDMGVPSGLLEIREIV